MDTLKKALKELYSQNLYRVLKYFSPDNLNHKDISAIRHPQKWSTDLPGYRIGIPIGIALRKQWTDIAIVISCSFYTIKSLNK